MRLRMESATAEDKMKSAYKLIKLRTTTVTELTRLRSEMGLAGLDELLGVMVRATKEYRAAMGDMGWRARLDSDGLTGA